LAKRVPGDGESFSEHPGAMDQRPEAASTTVCVEAATRSGPSAEDREGGAGLRVDASDELSPRLLRARASGRWRWARRGFPGAQGEIEVLAAEQ